LSARLIVAALTNWGRAPTIVAIFEIEGFFIDTERNET
jgi:hypothetical protein